MREICRLCLKSTGNFFRNLSEYKEAVKLVIPEINFDIVPSAVICDTCRDLLENAYKFKRSCIDSEERIKVLLKGRNGNGYTLFDILNPRKVVVKEEICGIIQTEVSDPFADIPVTTDSTQHVEPSGLSTIKKYHCAKCKIDFFLVSNFQIHLRGHTGKAYNCEICYQGFDSGAELINHGAEHSILINLVESDKQKKANAPKIVSKTLLGELLTVGPEIKTKPKTGVNNSRRNVKRKKSEIEVTRCVICGVLFATLNELYVHLNDRHTPTLALVKVTDDEIARAGNPRKFAKRNRSAPREDKRKDEAKLQEELIDILREETADKSQFFKCDFCEVSFKIYEALQDHLKTHYHKKRGRKPATFHCEYCGFTAVSANLRDRHKNGHILYSRRRLVCKLCNRRFVDPSTFSFHQRKHDEISDIRCEECPMRFTSHPHYLTHQKYQHSDDECDGCGEPFNDGDELMRHVRTCKYKYFCKFCDFDAKYKQRLQTHLLIHGLPLAQTKCEVCDYESKSRLKLTEHMRLHCEIKDVTCGECDLSFISFSDLNNHAFKHLRSLPHKPAKNNYKTCPLCEEILRSDTDLSNHMNNHDDIMDIECDHCEFRFFDELSYCEHVQKIHLTCSNCSTRFDDPDTMREHMQLCPKLNSTECGFCKYKSITFVEYKRHITAEHPTMVERKYECTLCNRRFRTKRDLAWHSEQHDIVKDVRCNYCDFRFISDEHHHQHLANHTYKCKFCDVVVESRDALTLHVVKCKKNPDYIQEIIVFGDEGKLTCTHCNEVFPSMGHLNEHFKRVVLL